MRKKSTTPTRKQLAVLNFVREFVDKNKFSPSYREISNGVGISVGTAVFHVGKLVEHGIVAADRSVHRSIKIVKDPWWSE